ncbi:MAG: hypothetical protein SFT92_01965 [Rickettsiales bacterium]|nr:hypothetical protein [Rickettsiales bacterium]
MNQTDMYGNTALHHAQSGEMTELLLQYDANPHLLNRQGQTPQQAQESRLNEQLAWQEKELSDPRLSAGVVEMVANGYKERHDKLDRSIRSVETAAKKTDFIEIYGLAKEYRKDGYLSTNISYQQDHETGVIRNHNQADVEGSMIEPEVKAFLNGRPVPLEELGDINEVLDRTAPPFAPTMAAPTPTPTPEPSKAEPAFMPKPESLPEHPFKELILTYIPTDPNDNITNGTLTLARATGLPEMPLAKHAPTANKPSRGGP